MSYTFRLLRLPYYLGGMSAWLATSYYLSILSSVLILSPNIYSRRGTLSSRVSFQTTNDTLYKSLGRKVVKYAGAGRLSTSDAWELVTRGKAAILTTQTTIDKRTVQALRRSDASYCRVKMIPGHVHVGHPNIGLLFQKAAPYLDQFNQV